MTRKSVPDPEAYLKLPLDSFTIKDLTDALGVAVAAKKLGTTARAIYTVRNTNNVSVERFMQLVSAVREDEAACRRRLVILRNMQKARADMRDPETV